MMTINSNNKIVTINKIMFLTVGLSVLHL